MFNQNYSNRPLIFRSTTVSKIEHKFNLLGHEETLLDQKNVSLTRSPKRWLWQTCHILRRTAKYEKLVYSTEYTYSLHGYVKPIVIDRQKSKWASIIKGIVLELFYLENNLTGVRYLIFLQKNLKPALTTLYPKKENPDRFSENVWLRRNEASPLCSWSAEIFEQNFSKWMDSQEGFLWVATKPNIPKKLVHRLGYSQIIGGEHLLKSKLK